MWFRMKRVRSDLVGEKFGLMRETFLAVLAVVSTVSLPWMPTDRGMGDKLVRRV